MNNKKELRVAIYGVFFIAGFQSHRICIGITSPDKELFYVTFTKGFGEYKAPIKGNIDERWLHRARKSKNYFCFIKMIPAEKKNEKKKNSTADNLW